MLNQTCYLGSMSTFINATGDDLHFKLTFLGIHGDDIDIHCIVISPCYQHVAAIYTGNNVQKPIN